jgi:HEPN domain-containing protein
MMPKPADDWLKLAHDDLKAGESTLRDNIFNISCFHAQQAAEKALKAFLVDSNVSHPKTHNLVDLNELCAKINSEFSGLMAKLVTLNQFYAPTRYPDAAVGMTPGGTPSKNLTREALDDAREVVEFCSERIREVRFWDEKAKREHELSDDRDDDR